MATEWLWEFRHRRRLIGAYPATNYPLLKCLLIVLAAVPFAAAAQQGHAPETGIEQPNALLSNAGASSAGWTDSVLAQGFITGHIPGGYRLGGVELFLDEPPDTLPARPVVTLHEDEIGEPGERVVVFANPASYTAGGNRFEAPLPIVLSARKAYHLLVNLGADRPLALELVFPGKADGPSADAQWVARTGSQTLLDNLEWRFNDGFALRFTLLEAGEDIPPPAPRLSLTVAAAVPVAAPPGDSEDSGGSTAQVEPDPRDESFEPAPMSAPGSSEATSAGFEGAASSSASIAATDESAATADTPDPPPAEAAMPAPPPPAAPEAAADSPTPIMAQNSRLPETSDDDDDEAAVPVPRSSPSRTGVIVGAALAGVALIAGSDGDDSPPGEQPSQTTPPDPPPPPPPPPLSDDAALSALAVSDTDGAAVALMPMFSSTVASYLASVSNSVSVVTVLPMANHAEAEFEFLGGDDMPLAVANGGTADFQANLVVGTTTVKVKVTAEDGEATQTYAVAIERAAPPPPPPPPLSDDATLRALSVSDGAGSVVPLTPMFSSALTSYAASVVHSVATVTIVPTTNQAEAEFGFLDGNDMPLADADTGTDDFQLDLVVGMTTVQVKVTAENGEAMQTYAIAIERAMPPPPPPLSDDARLRALAVTDAARIAIPLTPTFSSAVTSYTASVAHSVATVTILPMVSHAGATVEFLDSTGMGLEDADTGAADFQFNLDVGQNTVKVKVTAENGEAMQTYAVTLTRPIGPPERVLITRVLPGAEALIVFWNAVSLADGYRVQWKSGNQDFEQGGSREAIVTDGNAESYTILYLLAGREYTVRVIATRNGAQDAPPSNEAKGTPFGQTASVQPNSDGGRNDDGASNDGSDDGDDSEPEAWLADLEVFDPDGDEVALSPPFSTPTASYSATVANDVAWVTFKPTKNDPASVVVYEDGSNQTLTDADAFRGDFQVNLNVGANVVKVRVSHPEAQSQGTYTVTITRAAANDVNNDNEDNNQGDSNNAPEFPASTASRDFDENVGDATSSGIDLGAPITAADDDSDTLTYSLEGADEADFLIEPSTGQLSTRSGTNYSYETQTSYSVTVKADDSNGGTDTIAVTIDLNDLDEKPLKPAAPGVSSVSERWTRLTVSWSPPDNTGRPSIATYDLQYKKRTETDQDWKDGPQNVSGSPANLDNLEASTAYDVQIRATNADGDGPWSDSGSGTTSDAPPEIESNTTRSFDEDVGDGTRTGADVGAPVTASDHGANHSYTLSGTDAGAFSIGSTTGQIRTLSGANYDYEAQSSYSVIVDSDDGNSGTEAIQVIINVNDVTEKPTKPAAPMVDNIAGNTQVIYVTWTAPSNTGRPPILSYDLQYREAPSGSWFDGPQDETGITATIRGLSPSTEYDVQVRATNADGDGPWSDDGSATTSAALPATCLMSENGNSRLADGFTPKEGRVEVCAEDPDNSGSYIWGAVCDDYWTDEEAGVVCRQLGYYNSEPIGGRFLRAYFGESALDFLLDDMQCEGTESNLLGCMVASGGLASTKIGMHNCKATEAVGVRCLTQSEYEQHVLQIGPDENNPSATLSIADVDVYETAGTTMDFVVTLAGTAQGTVTVNYATQDGTAKANVDYVPKSGMVTFPPGTTSQTIRITVLDDLVDEHDEHGERMTVRLSSAIGARIVDGVGYGTIENSDPLPQAWLVRFGRAAADQAVEAVTSRMFEQQGARASELTVAGHRLDLTGDVDPAVAAAMAQGMYGAYGWPSSGRGVAGWPSSGRGVGGWPSSGRGSVGWPSGGRGVAGWPSFGMGSAGFGQAGLANAGYGGSNAYGLLAGSSFRWALGADGDIDADSGRAGREPGAIWTAWGSGAATRFSGSDDTLSLYGDIATATLGLDRELGSWLTGVALAFSVGEGGFAPIGDASAVAAAGGAAALDAAVVGAADGAIAGGLIETTLTTLYPYARYAVNDRLSVWGMLGYGQGDLRLIEGRAGTAYVTDTGMVMGAFGARGVILERNGFELALRTDAMQVRTDSDSAPGLASSTGDTGRVRALLEGSRSFALGTGRSLEPTVEFGLRNDSGDAETGSGVELGLGVRYSDAALGLSVEARARGLVTHQDANYEEWGAWATVRIDPGDDGRGVSLSLSPSWGVAGSGMNRIWNSGFGGGYGAGFGRGYGGAPGYGGTSGNQFDTAGRLTAELGYGVGAFQGLGLGTWYLGLDRGRPGRATLAPRPPLATRHATAHERRRRPQRVLAARSGPLHQRRRARDLVARETGAVPQESKLPSWRCVLRWCACRRKCTRSSASP